MRGGPAIAGGLRALRRVVHVALWSGVGVGGLSVAFAAVVLAPYHLRPRWVLEALPILGTWHDVDPASAVGLLLLLVVVPFVSARAFDELAGRGGHELRIRRDLAETPADVFDFLENAPRATEAELRALIRDYPHGGPGSPR